MNPGWTSDFAASLNGLDPQDYWLLVGLAAVASVGGLFTGFVTLYRGRLIENTPTSLIRSAAQGYVELTGHSRLLPGPEVISPLTGARCCWWRYKVEKLETHWSNGRQQRRWHQIAAELSDELFLLADQTGDCVVDPDGAKVHPSIERRWRGSTPRPRGVPERIGWLQFGDYRYTEALIGIGDPLYALGWFRTQSHRHEFDRQADLRDLLAEWKADRQTLLERFDTNGDGKIDLDEWEAARRAAIAQVDAEHAERAADAALRPDVNVLSRTADGRPFILSTLSQKQLTRRYRIGGWSGILLGLAGTATLLLVLAARGFMS